MEWCGGHIVILRRARSAIPGAWAGGHASLVLWRWRTHLCGRLGWGHRLGGIHSPWIRNPVPWETCYRLFRTWQRDGTWAHALSRQRGTVHTARGPRSTSSPRKDLAPTILVVRASFWCARRDSNTNPLIRSRNATVLHLAMTRTATLAPDRQGHPCRAGPARSTVFWSQIWSEDPRQRRRHPPCLPVPSRRQ